MNYEVEIRRAAELDIAEAQLWYESQRSGLGAQFHSELIQVIDRLSQTPHRKGEFHAPIQAMHS